MSVNPARPERIHFFQLRDAAGRPDERDFVVPIDYKPLSRVSVSLAQQLRPLKPRLTEHPGVYWYLDDGVGSGWLRVEETHPVDVDRLHKFMIVADLSLATGHEEPWPVDPTIIGQAGAPRAGNPYLLIGWGAVTFGIACFGLFRIFFSDAFDDGPGTIFAGICMVLLAGVSTVLVVRGVKRMAWWRAARAEARRRGIPLPDKLSGTGA